MKFIATILFLLLNLSLNAQVDLFVKSKLVDCIIKGEDLKLEAITFYKDSTLERYHHETDFCVLPELTVSCTFSNNTANSIFINTKNAEFSIVYCCNDIYYEEKLTAFFETDSKYIVLKPFAKVNFNLSRYLFKQLDNDSIKSFEKIVRETIPSSVIIFQNSKIVDNKEFEMKGCLYFDKLIAK